MTLFVLRMGCVWRDRHEELGPWHSFYQWFNTRASHDKLDEMVQRLVATLIEVGEINEDYWCVDGTCVPLAMGRK